MQIKYIDGFRLRNAIIAGSEVVFKMRTHLNQINLFPIPDKDTGTNLSATLRNVVTQLKSCESQSIHETSQVMAEGAILAAQGNSGAILAQFFQSLADELSGQIKISVQAFSQAVEKATLNLNKVVLNPVEGTIVSVIEDWARSIKKYGQKSHDFTYVLKNALHDAQQSLQATMYKIEVLRKARVVDAGAQGFVNLLEGIAEFIEYGRIREIFREGISESHSLSEATFNDFEMDLRYQYCVESLIITPKSNKEKIQELLKDFGDSLTIANSRRLTRVHLHTNQPEKIKTLLSPFGKLQSFRVKNLIEQQQEALAQQQAVKIGLVTDSSCDLPHELVTKYHVNVVPVRLHFGDETFIDKQTITPLEFYEKLKASPIHPTTSQPTPADFIRTYKRLAQKYPAILSIILADKLSGTFRAAKTAASHIKNRKLVLIDSRTTSIALGLLVIEAGEAILAGHSIDEVAKRVRSVIDKLSIIINIPSLKYLVRGGRVSKSKGLIATLLNIKPMLTFNEEGKISEFSKAFGNMGMLRKTIKIIRQKTQNLNNIRVGIVHANAIGKAQWMAQKISQIPNIHSIIIHDVAPVLGVHAGPGTVGVAFWGEGRRSA
jgi:DegV family protein with EDD domain